MIVGFEVGFALHHVRRVIVGIGGVVDQQRSNLGPPNSGCARRSGDVEVTSFEIEHNVGFGRFEHACRMGSGFVNEHLGGHRYC